MSYGLAYEMAVQADLGFVIMSAGSIAIATGSLMFAKLMPFVRKMN